MVIKQAPRVWTGYMNFSPDLISKDFAEPRAQSLGEQGARRANIAAQNTRKLQSASRSAPSARRFALAKTDAKRIDDQVNNRLRQDNIKAAANEKYERIKAQQEGRTTEARATTYINPKLSKPERYAQTKYAAAKTATKSYLKEKLNRLRGKEE